MSAERDRVTGGSGQSLLLAIVTKGSSQVVGFRGIRMQPFVWNRSPPAGVRLETLTFTVDAALLRELGERLIGQPHIALSELVKNSYDADAATCRILLAKDKIEIIDDGRGMSLDEFSRYWMRLGTTHKVDQGVSSRLKRPLTGSKGVGRLAAQFLADEMTLETTSEDDPTMMLVAIVDWRKAIRGAELSSVPVEYEIRPNDPGYPNGHPHGTRIVLTQLKNAWGPEELRDLGRELWMLRSPFRRRTRSPTTRGAEDFDVEVDAPDIAQAREAFDDVVKRLFENWKARIHGSLEKGRSGSQASVTLEFAPEGKDAAKKTFRERVSLPVRSDGETNQQCLIDRVSFEILIFKIEGRQVGGIHVGDLREYLKEHGNVAIYDSKFRLPYYGAEHDWLDIALDQSRRISISELLPAHLRIEERYMLDLPAPGRILGAVDIDTGHERSVADSKKSGPGDWLQIQPGRDRLHDNPAFKQLRDLVRFSLDYYANRNRAREALLADEERSKEPATAKQERALVMLDRHEATIPKPVFREVRREVAEALKASKAEEKALDARAVLLAPLAAAGMAALALNHELSRETRVLEKAADDLRRIAKKHGIPELSGIATEFDSTRFRLESLQDLFAPLLSEMDKTATDRLRVRQVVEQATNAMKFLMPGVDIDLRGIPADLRFPVGSLAEWNALIQNLLSNAWNAMLEGSVSKIQFAGGQGARNREWLHVSDTGAGLGLPLEQASKLFEPFERQLKISEDKKSIALGGQGLGLAIVRMIARRRRADVAFVKPESGYATTFEMSWKG